MDNAAILRQLDAERQTVPDSDASLEKTPFVVRAFGAANSWAAIVYSHFSSSQAETIINSEVAYFAKLNQDFEWKVYSQDEPPDLLRRLSNHQFKIGEEESLMICDPGELSSRAVALSPVDVTVSPVRDEQTVEDYLAVESSVWSCEPTKSREILLSTFKDPFQRDLGFVAYRHRKPVGSGRVTAPRSSQFAGLWGGSVLPDYRGRGVYGALVSARIQYLRQFDSIRHLRVDARPTSRPILEKYGFHRVASTWPAEWAPPHARQRP